MNQEPGSSYQNSADVRTTTQSSLHNLRCVHVVRLLCRNFPGHWECTLRARLIRSRLSSASTHAISDALWCRGNIHKNEAFFQLHYFEAKVKLALALEQHLPVPLLGLELSFKRSGFPTNQVFVLLEFLRGQTQRIVRALFVQNRPVYLTCIKLCQRYELPSRHPKDNFNNVFLELNMDEVTLI